jgi:type VI secretion system secreted protein Hcp
LNALATNENLTSVKLSFLGPTGETVFSYTLTNANISARQITHTGATGDAMLEQVSFTWQKLEETFTNGGVTAAVDWEARVN